jgi:hypothetical protein
MDEVLGPARVTVAAPTKDYEEACQRQAARHAVLVNVLCAKASFRRSWMHFKAWNGYLDRIMRG